MFFTGLRETYWYRKIQKIAYTIDTGTRSQTHLVKHVKLSNDTSLELCDQLG